MIKPQKALHLYQEEDKKKPKHIGSDYMVFEKHDGWYGYLDLPSCTIHSRAMREIPALREMSEQISLKRPQVRGRLIFEIMIEGLEYNSFPELNGRLNRKHEQEEEAYLQVHDFLYNFRMDMPADKRYEFAKEIVTRLDTPKVRISPLLGVSDDPLEWAKIFTTVTADGGEGVILKKADAVYMPEKRNFTLMKIKEELTLDLLVVGMVRGKGKYEDTLGALEVQDSFGIKHTVSGMSDEERFHWWRNKGFIEGKVVEVKAMKRLKDGSLREPRFKSVRFDKTAEDID